MTVTTRFAPSPTGFLHIGGVRTALFCWLYARRHGGRFILRIEDTDRERSTQEAVAAILDGMAWLGLNWDEGPYYQTRRLETYRRVAEAMLEQGLAYRCYCSREELDSMRAAQIARGENPRYDGRCRERTQVPEAIQPVVRFRTPQTGTTVVDDLVRGRVEFHNAELDDLVILRSDGMPTYHFSVVVDDGEMRVTHVIRGDDHLNNTPRQILMIEALGYVRPQYAHLPMIHGHDGAKLSKRHGAVNVLQYRDEGYLPEALLNYLVRLGWSHGDQEVFSLEEMIGLFDLSGVNASAARFDPEKLAWLNQQHIKALPLERLVPGFEQQLSRRGIEPGAGPASAAVVEALRERAATLADMAESAWYFYQEPAELDAAACRKFLTPGVVEPLRLLADRLAALSAWERGAIHATLAEVAQQFGMGFGKLGQPLRVALTGGTVSPPIDVTAELIGQHSALVRLRSALALIESGGAAGAT